MEKRTERMLRYYQRAVEVPCQIQYDYNHERGNKDGRAYVTIFLSQTTLHGRPCEGMREMEDFKFDLALTGRTRKQKKSIARQKINNAGRDIISKLRSEGVISFARKK